MKTLTKALGIAALSFLPMKDYAQKVNYDFIKELSQKIEKSTKSKMISLEVHISENREVFGKPLSFIIDYNFSDSSKLSMYYSDICKYDKIREVTFFDQNRKKEDLTPMYKTRKDKNKLERWFKSTQRQLRNVPPGVYEGKSKE